MKKFLYIEAINNEDLTNILHNNDTMNNNTTNLIDTVETVSNTTTLPEQQPMNLCK